MKVLVTGATGFIGNHVTRMCLEQGDEVRVMVMPGEDRSPLDGMNVEFVEGNLLDSASLRKCVEGIEGLYHLAAIYAVWTKDPNLQYKVNVEGARAMLHAKYVKAYVRRTKTDAADADALILADRDDSLHAIPVKSEELQALQGLHRIREQWNRARVARICEARALLVKFGISSSAGVRGIGKKLTLATEQTRSCIVLHQSPYDLLLLPRYPVVITYGVYQMGDV
jgi:hypothetical protein